MQTYSGYRPTEFDHPGLGLPEQQGWLVLDLIQTRDSGPLDQSNFATALITLGGEGEFVEVASFNHWGPGWFEIIIVDPSSDKHIKIAEEIESCLSEYPVLDDDDLEKREHEAENEGWENWAESDFCRAIEYDDGVDRIGDLTGYELLEIFRECCERANVYWEAESDGMTIDVEAAAAEFWRTDTSYSALFGAVLIDNIDTLYTYDYDDTDRARLFKYVVDQAYPAPKNKYFDMDLLIDTFEINMIKLAICRDDQR
jgi:hypothetical protein